MSKMALLTCIVSPLWCLEHLGLPGPALSQDLSSRLARLLYIAAQVVREQKQKLPVLWRPKPGTITAPLKSIVWVKATHKTNQDPWFKRRTMDFTTQWEEWHPCIGMRGITGNHFCRHSATVGMLISSQHFSYERNWAAGKSRIFGANSCQCMTKPTAMLWNGWPPTNKNKWKKKRIFGNLAFLITKLLSPLSGRISLVSIWLRTISFVSHGNWVQTGLSKKRERENILTHLQGNLGKYWEIQGWPGLRGSTCVIRNVLLPSSVLPHSLILKQALSTRYKDGHQQLQICVLRPQWRACTSPTPQ